MKHRRPPTAKQLAYQKKVNAYNDARTSEVEEAKTTNIINLIRKSKKTS